MVVYGGDVGSYLQEERQNRHKGVGAAREQGEGSAAVHPQRIILCYRHQPENKNICISKCLHLLVVKCTTAMFSHIFSQQDLTSN